MSFVQTTEILNEEPILPIANGFRKVHYEDKIYRNLRILQFQEYFESFGIFLVASYICTIPSGCWRSYLFIFSSNDTLSNVCLSFTIPPRLCSAIDLHKLVGYSLFPFMPLPLKMSYG